MAPDPRHVARAQKLHEMHAAEQNPYRKVAIQKKIHALPPEVHAAAKAQAHASPKAAIDTPQPLHDLADKVKVSYDEVFDAQMRGLHELESTLEHIKPPTNVVAQLALTAVTIGISAVLGPAAGMALEGIEGELAEVLKTGMEKTIDAAIDGAKERMAGYLEGGEESDPNAIRNFIDWQSQAISAGKAEAKDNVIDLTSQLVNAGDLDLGLKALTSLHKSVKEQAAKAEQIQILHSAGEWAAAAREEVMNSAGVTEEPTGLGVGDVDNDTLTGQLELWVSLTIATPGPTVTRANWAKMSKSLESLVKEQGSLPLRELGVTLHVYLDVEDEQGKHHKAEFEYSPAPEATEGAISMPSVVAPEDPAQQRVIANAVSRDGEVSDSELALAATTAISQLGYDIASTPVGSLKFG